MKQYDLDTDRVVMVENPDGSYVLASEARELIHKIAELEKEKKALEDRLGALEMIFKPGKGKEVLCSDSNDVDKSASRMSGQIFYR